MISTSEIIINGQLVSFCEKASEEQRTGASFIFLHGWRSRKEIWNNIASRIKDKGIRIYLIDLPGFGASPPPGAPWTIGDYANLVKGFIEKLKLTNVVLVGHSFGGRVAIKLCATPATPFPGQPEASFYGQGGRIKKLILVDSAGFAMSSRRRNLMRVLAKIIKPIFKPKFMRPLRKKIYEKIGAEDYVAASELAETFKNIVSEDLSGDMRKINIPTLIIWGENDKETPVESGKRMHSIISAKDGSGSGGPNSKLETLSGAGHFCFLDKPEEFARIINDFIPLS